MRGIIFLLVILIITCMIVPVDGFLGQPQRNKTQCNQDCQNEIRRKQNAEKKALSGKSTEGAPRVAQSTSGARAPTTTPTLSGKSTSGASAAPTTTPVRK